MNAEEKQALKERIARAERLENQIRNLKDGITKLRSGECARVSIPVLASDTVHESIQWMQAGTNQYRPVCWASSEEGLPAELLTLVIDALQRRHDAAVAELEVA